MKSPQAQTIGTPKMLDSDYVKQDIELFQGCAVWTLLGLWARRGVELNPKLYILNPLCQGNLLCAAK